MKKFTGYIALYRQLLDWQWFHEENCLCVWITLLLSAAYKPTRFGKYTLQPGQYRTSRVRLAREAGLSEQQLRTVLEKLISSGDIDIDTDNNGTTITICNWSAYQSRQTEPQSGDVLSALPIPSSNVIDCNIASLDADVSVSGGYPVEQPPATSDQPAASQPKNAHNRGSSPLHLLQIPSKNPSSNQHNIINNNNINLSTPTQLLKTSKLLVTHWHDATGLWLRRYQVDGLIKAATEFGLDRVLDAMDMAGRHGDYPLAYFYGVLNNWRIGIDYQESAGIL